MGKSFWKITILYILGIAAAFATSWTLINISVPDSKFNLINALSTALGIYLPDNLAMKASFDIRTISVIIVISIISIFLILLNVYFGAIVTSYFIRPRINLAFSKFGVLSNKWNQDNIFILVRICNFNRSDLLNVRTNVMLSVEESCKSDSGDEEKFIAYFPVHDFTPPHIMIMKKKMPWTIAVPSDVFLSNSRSTNYSFSPGNAILNSFSNGKKLFSAKRTIEILIEGLDSKSYSNFIHHQSILVDEQVGDEYKLHLHRGAFKSLPLQIISPNELEQYES